MLGSSNRRACEVSRGKRNGAMPSAVTKDPRWDLEAAEGPSSVIPSFKFCMRCLSLRLNALFSDLYTKYKRKKIKIFNPGTPEYTSKDNLQ
jgi:hypothetical protein